jgi:hypothetical protein
VLLLYTDDSILAGPDEKEINEIIKEMQCKAKLDIATQRLILFKEFSKITIKVLLTWFVSFSVYLFGLRVSDLCGFTALCATEPRLLYTHPLLRNTLTICMATPY